MGVRRRAARRQHGHRHHIVSLYDQLLDLLPTGVVANRAVAIAETDGPGSALALIDELSLEQYQWWQVARAEMLLPARPPRPSRHRLPHCDRSHRQRDRAPIPADPTPSARPGYLDRTTNEVTISSQPQRPPSGPLAHLLAGLPGSGKSTYARRLERTGVIRISVDDAMLHRHGRIGIDYPIEAHHMLVAPILSGARQRMVDALAAGCSVVVDHGLGRRDERDDWKRLVIDAGARWRLLRFDTPYAVLQERLTARRQRPAEHRDAVPITADMLEHLADTYEPPVGEGEIVVRT